MEFFTGKLWKKSAVSAVTLRVYFYGALTAPIACYRRAAAQPSLQYKSSPLHVHCATGIVMSANSRTTSPALPRSGRDRAVEEVLV